MSALERHIFGGCGPEWDAESRARIMAILAPPACDDGRRLDAATLVRFASERNPAALLVPLLGRRDVYGVFEGRWRTERGDPAGALERHLRGDIVLGARHGGTAPTGREIAFDVDGPQHVSQSADADPCAALDLLLSEIARLGFAPALVAMSKSGSGYHARVLLSDDVETALAARVARAVVARVARPECREPYPGATGDGLVLALPLSGLLGSARYVAPGGSRFVGVAGDIASQCAALRSAARSTPDMVRAAAAELGVLEAEPAPEPAPVVDRSRDPLPHHTSEIDVLAAECAFVQHAATDPQGMTYRDWFGLATILRVFAGGAAYFDAISRGDARRYRRGEPARKLATVRGAPRHCRNLDYSCPKLGSCEALGVRSPAGLPFKLAAAERRQKREARA